MITNFVEDIGGIRSFSKCKGIQMLYLHYVRRKLLWLQPKKKKRRIPKIFILITFTIFVNSKQRLLYSPLGKTYIVQPDERLSPPHPLLPEGAAFYMLEKTYTTSKSTFASALRAFLNSPHPLETLSDLKAYGSDGTILRDHESSNYFRAIDGVLRLHMRMAVSRSKEERLRNWWPLIAGHRKEDRIAHRCSSGKELVTEV